MILDIHLQFLDHSYPALYAMHLSHRRNLPRIHTRRLCRTSQTVIHAFLKQRGVIVLEIVHDGGAQVHAHIAVYEPCQ